MAKKTILTIPPQILAGVMPAFEEWRKNHSQLSQLKATEVVLRNQVLGVLAQQAKIGTSHVIVGDLDISIVRKLTYKLDYPAFFKLSQSTEFQAAGIPANIIKPQDPVLDQKVYDTLTQEQKYLLRDVVTIDEAQASMKVTTITPEDAA